MPAPAHKAALEVKLANGLEQRKNAIGWAARRAVEAGYTEIKTAHPLYPGDQPDEERGYPPDASFERKDGARCVVATESMRTLYYPKLYSTVERLKALSDSSAKLYLLVPPALLGKAKELVEKHGIQVDSWGDDLCPERADALKQAGILKPEKKPKAKAKSRAQAKPEVKAKGKAKPRKRTKKSRRKKRGS